jgi:twitching motility protein PilT
MDVTDLLARAVAAGASDLHLAAGEPPMLRLDGELQRMALPVLSCAALEQEWPACSMTGSGGNG